MGPNPPTSPGESSSPASVSSNSVARSRLRSAKADAAISRFRRWVAVGAALFKPVVTGTFLKEGFAVMKAMLAAVRAHWGLGSRAMADIFFPDADSAMLDALARLTRESASPEVAERLYGEMADELVLVAREIHRGAVVPLGLPLVAGADQDDRDIGLRGELGRLGEPHHLQLGNDVLGLLGGRLAALLGVDGEIDLEGLDLIEAMAIAGVEAEDQRILVGRSQRQYHPQTDPAHGTEASPARRALDPRERR